ncbi:hypothetical protein H310_06967 [Aphanomyces invadans]|uniref:Uncharacterized protein n=1 Tax=Aphanomyces invadans TaxID=157072 RepID=A0A024U799_9STRA|nr:hypothetical protein H310_06967 [Aphanomyces invadans]ETW01453.1 hypothetical protein H310_06967 [Aphanomyces invadans]|eukprot:XP_008870451.1 hypothetical protein H310_06967 [Aphanomyces invadans]
MAVAADFSGWVKELDSFKPSADDGDDDEEDRLQDMSATYTSRSKKGHASQLDEIKQEMKLLNWHKLANEAALKAALIKTKKLKREDARQFSLVDAEEHMERLQQIEEEENLKPLEVTAEFIRQYEEDERKQERRLEADVSRHINCLKKLKKMFEDREDIRRRHIQYREGKLALDHGFPLQVTRDHLSSNQDDDAQRENAKLTSRSSGNSNDVSRVLSSLDKLVELERRISSLEQDDIEPASAAVVAPLLKGSTTLKFTKTSNGRTTAQKVSSKSKQSKSKSQTSTFLTSVPEPKKSRLAAAVPSTGTKSREAQRAAELRRMPERDRQKALKMDKKQAMARQSAQQAVKIDQWAEKKKQAAAARKVNYVKSNQRAAAVDVKAKTTRGAKNRHMEDFQAMKRGFEAKKAGMAKVGTVAQAAYGTTIATNDPWYTSTCTAV